MKLKGCVRGAAAGATFLAAVAVASAASAVSFSGSYAVTAHDSGNGLLIQTQELADPLNFVLTDPGDMYTVDLFKIWTDESDVGWDDTVAKPISVDFDFTAPASMGGTIGTTVGGGFVFQEGRLTWNGPAIIDFGNGGQLHIALSDEDFNEGFFGLTPGKKHGAKVEAKFTLISDSVSQVPLPATLPLFMVALGGLAALRRRSRGDA